jgi:hypothetical protein
MRTLAIGSSALILLIYLASVSLSQSSTAKFAAALEDQIRCTKKPEPSRAIGAMQRAGIIRQNHYINVDSISYFRVRKPLTVFGLKVVSVMGFDVGRPFGRGPGTSPGLTIGVVVPVSVERAKQAVGKQASSKTSIDPAEDVLENNIQKNRTEISCSELSFFNSTTQ